MSRTDRERLLETRTKLYRELDRAILRERTITALLCQLDAATERLRTLRGLIHLSRGDSPTSQLARDILFLEVDSDL